MNRKIHLSPKQIFLSCLILCFFTLLTFAAFSLSRGQLAFQRLSRDLFREEMTANTLSMHYTLAYPENFGIRDYAPTLPCYTKDTYAKETLRLTQLLSKLDTLNKSSLSGNQSFSKSSSSSPAALTCTLLRRSLALELEMAEFPFYEEPLSPTQGSQSQLPILLGEYTFRRKRDVEDYLSLLSQTGTYFESLLLYEQEKQQAGTLMSAPSLLQAAKQCDTIVTSYALEEGTHFLQTGFRERLQELDRIEPLTQEEMDSYIRENERLLWEVLLPAYQNLGKGLMELVPLAPARTEGLAALPKGREYYACLLRRETGSSRTPGEAKELLQQVFLEEYRTIKALAEEYPGCVQALETGTCQDLGFSDTGDMLADLKSRICRDFPRIATEQEGWTDGYPPAQIKSVSPSLQDCSAPAYYLTAPMDDIDSNVIYLNPRNASSQLELYTTLAHEGYPGHLYQNAYTSVRLLSAFEDNRLRQLLWYGGYLEGWALYVEFTSFDYASRLLKEQDRPVDAVAVQIEKHNRSLQLCLYSLLDLMIHEEGASLSQISDYLGELGLSDPESASRIYQYICQSPCNYLKYYLGYLEILELKKTAEALWGSDYCDLSFHEFLLETGPADFTTLGEELLLYTPRRD